MSGELLSCPKHEAGVVLDVAEFRRLVVNGRCPVSGCELVPWSRAAARLEDGSTAVQSTGRCDRETGGCGAEWAPHGEAEVSWFGREVSVDWPDDPDDEL